MIDKDNSRFRNVLVNYGAQKYTMRFPKDFSDDMVKQKVGEYFTSKSADIKNEMPVMVDSGVEKKRLDVVDELKTNVKAQWNIFKGLATIATTAPEKFVGIPLEAYGEQMALSKDFETASKGVFNLLNKDLSLLERLRAIEPGAPIKEFGRAALAQLAEGTQIDERITDAGRSITKVNRDMNRALGLNRPKDKGEAFAYDVGAAFSSIAASVGLASIGANSATVGALYGVMAKSSMYAESKEAGKSPQEAEMIASAVGGFEAALEGVGLNIFLNKIKGSSLITRTALRAGEQGLQEALQQASESTIANIAGVRDESLKEIFSQIGYSAALGAITGAPVSAVYTTAENTGLLKTMRDAGLNDTQGRKIIETIDKAVKEKGINEVQSIINEVSDSLASSDAVLDMKQEIAEQTRDGVAGEPYVVKDEEYVKVAKMETKAALLEQIEAAGEGGVRAIKKLAQPISTRLADIHPAIATKLRRYEFDTKKAIQKDNNTLAPFAEKYAKIPDDERRQLSLALMNGQLDIILGLCEKHGMIKEYNQVKKLLDNLFDRAGEAGIEIGYRANYWSRKVKPAQIEKYLDYLSSKGQSSDIDIALEKKKESLGRELTIEEKTDLVNSYLRGFSFDKVNLSKPGQAKNRTVGAVTAEGSQFYVDSLEAVSDYIIGINEAIASKKFFGKGIDNREASIGDLILDLKDKYGLNKEQERELSTLLNARFTQRGAQGIFAMYRDIEYMMTMGHFYSALTQFGDLYGSIYKSGVAETARAFADAITKQSDVTFQDLGLDSIAEEFASVSGTARIVNEIFKITQLSFVDRVGKETFVNAYLSSLKKKTAEDFAKEFKDVLGDDAAQTYRDLQAGNITDDVAFLGFNALADFQPIAMSEMPVGYLKAGNWRLAYALKSYALRTIDVYNREAFRKIAKGGDEAKEGFKNLFKLVGALLAVNVPAEVIKNIVQGKKIGFEDLPGIAAAILMKLFFINKYSVAKAKKDGIGDVIISTLSPSTATLNALSKDTVKIWNTITAGKKDRRAKIEKLSDLNIIRRSPFLGDLATLEKNLIDAANEKKRKKKRRIY